MPQITAGPIYPVTVRSLDGLIVHPKVKLAGLGSDVVAYGLASAYPGAEPTDVYPVVVAQRWSDAELVGADNATWRIVPADPDGEVLEVEKLTGCSSCGPVASYRPS